MLSTIKNYLYNLFETESNSDVVKGTPIRNKDGLFLKIKVNFDSDMGHLVIRLNFQEGVDEEIKKFIEDNKYKFLKHGDDFLQVFSKPDKDCKFVCRFYKPLLTGKRYTLNKGPLKIYMELEYKKFGFNHLEFYS